MRDHHFSPGQAQPSRMQTASPWVTTAVLLTGKPAARRKPPTPTGGASSILPECRGLNLGCQTPPSTYNSTLWSPRRDWPGSTLQPEVTQALYSLPCFTQSPSRCGSIYVSPKPHLSASPRLHSRSVRRPMVPLLCDLWPLPTPSQQWVNKLYFVTAGLRLNGVGHTCQWSPILN